MIRILIVEDEEYVRESLVAIFRADGFECHACETAEEALEAPPADVALVDLRLPGMSGIDLLPRLRERDPALPVLILTGHGTITDAVEAMRRGALDFLTKPVEPEVVVERLRKAAERGRIERDRDRLRGSDELVAASPAMRKLLETVEQAARGDGAILLVGESGTGKELVARFIHERSPRRTGPLVSVDCSTVPGGLFEAEFFGHVKGAYTGAHRARAGHFSDADHGTLFLDQVGAIPREAQAKLLRALESGEVRPIGGTRPHRVDVRVVSATNEDLEARMEEGAFRRDLYYRVAAIPFRIPPLRERPEDLEALAERFAAPLALSPAGKKALQGHDWPGNARELRNLLERAKLAAPGPLLDRADLEPLLPASGADLNLRRRVDLFERDLFRDALRRAGGVKSEAARLLGIDPSNWSYHARRLKLEG
jgi:DNA-binding NtrC family response regulator